MRAFRFRNFATNQRVDEGSFVRLSVEHSQCFVAELDGDGCVAACPGAASFALLFHLFWSKKIVSAQAVSTSMFRPLAVSGSAELRVPVGIGSGSAQAARAKRDNNIMYFIMSVVWVFACKNTKNIQYMQVLT